MYPIDVADEVFSWGRSISSEIDDRVELQILTSHGAPETGSTAPAITVASPVFADSEEQATKALAALGTCPVIDRATVSLPYMPTTLANWYTAVMTKYPEGHRYSVDNMFTSASAEELLPGIRKIIETMPPHPSHFVFAGWKPSADRADMVYGLEDEIYLALYTSWHDPADDERYRDWAPSNMAAMSHLATGISLADENLARRPAKFITDPNMARLDQVRAAYDPDGLFHSWMAAGSRLTGKALLPRAEGLYRAQSRTALQRALEQYLAVVGGNHLHRRDLVHRRRDAAGGRRGMAGVGYPGRQLGVGAVAVHHHHRQLVVVGVHRRQADAPQVDDGAPVLAAERHRRGQRLGANLGHRQCRHARLRRR